MTDITIRPATIKDAGTIVALIHRLASFEQAATAPALTEETVRRDGFGERPRFTVLLAEASGHACGGVVLLESYSSWAGQPTLMVHDLFVEADMRGRTVGRKLLAEAARLAMARGCCRMDVNVLTWNRTAQDFYGALGFGPLEDWRPWRLDGPALARLAETRK
ncbi:MAG: GNAT family N-acetyltransferase [Alphaproteobacteria bacterium]|nr:GNAT family N-acetyltransferase [Alphaproteobacteria bacterium]